MEFKKIEKINEGKYITRYNIDYQTKSGKIKTYEMVSRNKNIQKFEDLHDLKTDAVVLIIHDANNEKILLNREFRMAPGEWVYNFPAGLIDPGETEKEAASRELWEETGLKLTKIEEIWKESYSAVGFSNEKNIVLIGTAEGEFKPSTSEIEEIDAKWYSKNEIKELLKKEHFAARTQAYCSLWCRS